MSVAYFEANIDSFWNFQNVKALQQKYFQDSPDVLILTDENFMFAVQVQQTDYITRPYFNISVKAQSWPNGTTTKGTVYQNLVPCTFDRFDNVFRKYNLNFSTQYNQIGLSQWLCPSRGYNFSLGGRYTNDLFQYVKIEVTACVNGSSQPWSPTCAPPSEIHDYLQANAKFEVKLYITNQIFNGNQPTNYTQAFLDDELFFYFIPNQIGDAVDIFFKKYIINTNLQIFPLLEDQKQELLYIKDQGDFVQRVWQGSPSDISYVSLFLRRSPYQIISSRSFQQFTDIMSLMGGFINVLLMIFGVIVGFYNTQQYRFKIANKVYNFDYGNPAIETKDEVMKHLTKKNINFTMGRDHGSQLGSAQNRDASILLPFAKSKFQEQQELIVETVGFKSRKDYLSAQIQGILSRSITLQIKFRFFINQLSCNRIFSNDRKCQLFYRANKQIDQDLDIYIILEKIKEVNLLKELILTADQQILFNFTPKPVISVTEEMKVKNQSRRRRGLIEEDQKQSVRFFRSMTNKLIPLKNQKSRTARDVKIFNTLYNAYERIASGKQSQVNGILINNLGKEIKDIFEVSRLIDFDHIHLKISNRIQNKLKDILVRVRQQKRTRLLHELLDCQINQEHDKEMDVMADQLAEFQVDVLQRNITFHRK